MDPDDDPVERLRVALVAYAQTQTRFRVTTESSQFWFDEDTAAYAAIAVIDREQPARRAVPVLVVDHETAGSDRLRRLWLSFGTEVWLMDPARRSVRINEPEERDAQVIKTHRNRSKLVIAKVVAKSACLPGFNVDVPDLFRKPRGAP